MVIYMALTTGYPVFDNIRMSLYDVNITTFRLGNAPFVGLDNYIHLLDDPAFLHAARTSFTFTVSSIILQFVGGFALALFFNHAFPGNGVLRAMLLLAWLLPAVVGGTLFRWMLDGDYGVFNHFLRSLGLIHGTEYWLLNPDTALAATVLANAWVGIPFNMMLLLAGLQSIPTTLYEAASIDGAGGVARFFHITVPMMRPVALSVMLLSFIYTFKVFDLIFVMTAGGPVATTTVLPIHIYKLTFSFFRFSMGAAAATLLLLALLTLAIAYSLVIRREEAS
jgi:multiple sugar transport system permease protein